MPKAVGFEFDIEESCLEHAIDIQVNLFGLGTRLIMSVS